MVPAKWMKVHLFNALGCSLRHMREHGGFWKNLYLSTDCARSGATVHNPG
jgi:hypothetical protein